MSVFQRQRVILLFLASNDELKNGNIIQGIICHTKNIHITNINFQHYAIRSIESLKFISI
jgi:hypothetical protein